MSLEHKIATQLQQNAKVTVNGLASMFNVDEELIERALRKHGVQIRRGFVQGYFTWGAVPRAVRLEKSE